MLTVMLGFQTYHQWADHQIEHHAEHDQEDEDCNLCDWQLQAFLKPDGIDFLFLSFNNQCEFKQGQVGSLRQAFFQNVSGRGPPNWM